MGFLFHTTFGFPNAFFPKIPAVFLTSVYEYIRTGKNSGSRIAEQRKVNKDVNLEGVGWNRIAT